MLLFKFEPKIKRYYIYNNRKTNADNLIISVLLFGISHFRLIRPKTKEQNGRMETHQTEQEDTIFNLKNLVYYLYIPMHFAHPVRFYEIIFSFYNVVQEKYYSITVITVTGKLTNYILLIYKKFQKAISNIFYFVKLVKLIF